MTSINDAKQISPLALVGGRVLLVAIGITALAALELGMKFFDSGLAPDASVGMLLIAGAG